MPPKRHAFISKNNLDGKSKDKDGGAIKENPDLVKGVKGGLLKPRSEISGKKRASIFTEEAALSLVGEEKHTKNETEVLWHHHQDTFKGIKLPCGLRPRPLTKTDHIIKAGDIDTLLSHDLSGLPGKLDLTRSQTQKYFGDISKEHFYKRYNWVHQQRQISFTNTKRLSEPTPDLLFDNELELLDHACLNYPFAPVRPERMDRKNHHLTYISNKLDQLDQRLKTEQDYKKELKLKEDYHTKEYTKYTKNMSSIDSSKKLLKSVKEQHAKEKEELKSNYDKIMQNLKIDNEDEYSIADSMFSSAFVNTTGMKDFSMSQQGGVVGVLSNEDSMEGGLPLTPRTRYIDGCIRQNLNPRSSLILRKTLTKELNLQHYSMGDQMGLLLAESISGLPFIQSINISDNKLSDVSLGPILTSIMSINNLLNLDVSENITGPIFAKLLAEYLAKPSCSLIKLTLKNADVDDFECQSFVNSLEFNLNLKELNLSNNKIGSAEILNTVMPDVVTGGESFALLLRKQTCKLESLKLNWNVIRLGGANDFAESLRYNSSLIYLDLSYNAFSKEGGLIIGKSLLYNAHLKTLIVSNNNIDARACFTICAGIVENHSIKLVQLDGNPIGDAGAKAMMRVAVTVGGRTKVTADRCNITMKDDSAWFNYDKPLHKYQLDMEQPYERAILLGLLHLVATHHSYIFNYVNYEAKASRPKDRDWKEKDMIKTGRPVDLIQIKAAANEDLMDEHEKATVKKLTDLKRAASDIYTATGLFQQVDVDGGGELDINEFAVLLEKVGVECDPARLQETMNLYDTDGGGTIGMVEFFMFLRSQVAEANDRLSDFLENPVMSQRGSGIKYIPPETGRFYVEVIDSFTTKEIYKKMTSHDRAKMVEAAKTSTDTTSMIQLAVPCFKMRMQEGLNTFDSMIAEGGDKVKVASKLLLQLSDSSESLRFLNRTLKEDASEWKKLKAEMGVAIKPILGYPNGYYELDLAVELDKFCFLRLCELSETIKEKRSEMSKLGIGITGDVSQKGNWTCFRNESLNDEPLEINSTFARELPKTGIVKFDYSYSARPSRLDVIMSDVKLVKILVYNNMIKRGDQMRVLEELKEIWRYTSKNAELSKKSPYAANKAKAVLIGKTCELFYAMIPSRTWEVQQSKSAEEINLVLSNETEAKNKPVFGEELVGSLVNVTLPFTEFKRKRGAAGLFLKPLTNRFSEDKTKVGNDNDGNENENENEEDHDVEEDEEDEEESEEEDSSDDEQRQESISNMEKMSRLVYLTEPKRDEFTAKLIQQLSSDSISDQAKASRLLDAIIDHLSKGFILCRHLAVVIAYFEFGSVRKTTHFGSYNVELVVAIYNRIVDIHNIEVVLRQLDGYEVGCIYCRLGWLALFNPLKPEGAWEVEVSRLEERKVAKMLCLLSTNEPGKNWLSETFKWHREADPMPGWELTVSWMSEEGMPNRGILTLIYYSGEGVEKKGCRPNVNYRYSLLNMVLPSEQEVVDDDTDRMNKELEEKKSDKYMLLNSTTFYTYLLNNSTIVKKRQLGDRV